MDYIIYNNVRISILSRDIFRIEIKGKKGFSDRNTFFIPNLNNFTGYEFEDISTEEKIRVNIEGIILEINKNARNFSSLKALHNEDVLYKFKGVKITGELPKPSKTPLFFEILDNPHIYLPENGYSEKSFEKGEKFEIEEDSKDLYLIFTNKDHKLLRKHFISLTGRAELVRMQTLGLWNSRYYAYTQDEAKKMIDDYKAHDVYLDNMVIDTDWREEVASTGTGYAINEKLFPDMKEFLNYAHENNVEIMFNDHPLPISEKSTIFDKDEVIYREKNLKEKLELGLDYWWYDRNWTCRLNSITDKVYVETLGAYMYQDITRNYFKSLTKGKYYKRPIAMSNVDNIINGDYQYIRNVASHRYSFQWTGDIGSSLGSLSNEVINMVKAGNSGICFYSSDIGGHIGNPSKEEFIRWIQYGVMSPICRPHSTKLVLRHREPWNYDEETLNITRKLYNMRSDLMAVLYKSSFEAYNSLEPICKSLDYRFVNDKKASKVNDEYLFGNCILVAPIGSDFTKNLAKLNYFSKIHAIFYEGTELKGKPILEKDYDELNFRLLHNKLEEELPIYNFSAKFSFKLNPQYDLQLSIKSDDGVRVYINDELKLDNWTNHGLTEDFICDLKKDETYDVYIEYYQGGGEAGLILCEKEFKNKEKTIYLPESEWVDVYKGRVYKGNKTIKYNGRIDEFPLYVLKGSLIPLYRKPDQVRNLNLKNIVYDYYPSKTNSCKDYVYEDDCITTAYKDFVYRISKFSTNYNNEENCYEILLNPSINNLEDGNTYRNAVVRINYLNEFKKIKKILVNGEEVQFKVHNKDNSLYPFNGSDYSFTSKCAVIKFKQELNLEYLIKIFAE